MTWTIRADQIDGLARGAAVLGTGGGGDPYIGALLAKQALGDGSVTAVALDELPDDALVLTVAMMGAPTVMVEKLPSLDEIMAPVHALGAYLGRPVTHVACAEVGGVNSTIPIAAAAALGLPLVDADGMGRAFPHLEMVTPTLYGGSATPFVMVDEHGNTMFLESGTNAWGEAYARAGVLASGANAAMALYPMTGAEAKQRLVRGALTLAQDLGRSIREARAAHTSPVDAVIAKQGGVLLFTGKVEEVDRRNERGWTIGQAHLSGLDDDRDRTMTIHFQNENLAAERDGVVVATSPDLIMAMELDTGEPIPAEEIRYGYRVAVIGLPADPHWRTAAGIELAGPRRFGYEMDYRPVEEFVR